MDINEVKNHYIDALIHATMVGTEVVDKITDFTDDPLVMAPLLGTIIDKTAEKLELDENEFWEHLYILHKNVNGNAGDFKESK